MSQTLRIRACLPTLVRHVSLKTQPLLGARPPSSSRWPTALSSPATSSHAARPLLGAHVLARPHACLRRYALSGSSILAYAPPPACLCCRPPRLHSLVRTAPTPVCLRSSARARPFLPACCALAGACRPTRMARSLHRSLSTSARPVSCALALSVTHRPPPLRACTTPVAGPLGFGDPQPPSCSTRPPARTYILQARARMGMRAPRLPRQHRRSPLLAILQSLVPASPCSTLAWNHAPALIHDTTARPVNPHITACPRHAHAHHHSRLHLLTQTRLLALLARPPTRSFTATSQRSHLHGSLAASSALDLGPPHLVLAPTVTHHGPVGRRPRPCLSSLACFTPIRPGEAL
ncbi:hypothetical protein FS749_001430 [Ceratobasidium sp. UAMH 11750]|nr:hypothetical protein FS749_001430 [Ceratobasidium sp. UAMH 11750]